MLNNFIKPQRNRNNQSNLHNDSRSLGAALEPAGHVRKHSHGHFGQYNTNPNINQKFNIKNNLSGVQNLNNLDFNENTDQIMQFVKSELDSIGNLIF